MSIKNGSFIAREVPFSQVSNCALRDNVLSLKAKGLYSLIQSYITLPNFILYKSFLMNQCKEGLRAFESAWKELKDNGYLKQYRSPTGHNNTFIYYYELLDSPDLSTPSIINLTSNGEDNSDSQTNVLPPPTKCTLCETYAVRNASGAKCRGYINTDNNNTKDNITYITDSAEETEENVKKQIEYKSLMEEHTESHELINAIVSTMSEVLNSKRKKYKVGESFVDGGCIKQTIYGLTKRHIDRVIAKISKVKNVIKNLKAYLLVCLYKVSNEHVDYTPSAKPTFANSSRPASYDLKVYEDMLKDNRHLIKKYAYLL